MSLPTVLKLNDTLGGGGVRSSAPRAPMVASKFQDLSLEPLTWVHASVGSGSFPGTAPLSDCKKSDTP